MPTEAKRETVAELRDELANARTLIVSEYRGLKVKEIAEIRRALRKQDVTYRVVKNRLLRIAAERLGRRGAEPAPLGPTAIAFGRRGRARPAVLDATRPRQARADHRRLLGDRAIGADDVARLAALRRARSCGQAGRGDAGAGGHARRPLRGAAAQPRLRPPAGGRPEGRQPGSDPHTAPPTPERHQGDLNGNPTQDDLLEAIDKMTVLELSEFIKRFESATA